MAERDAPRPPPPSRRDVASEDFLFHLYRGSELLQDNRVHEAKAELEHALSLQPSDPKGQDLLGVVYFRLGLYPRAITIYERLVKTHPSATGPKINLALAYLKTGQPQRAREELEQVVTQNPQHSRAWGYLGLAFQRLGDLTRASYAFQAGGHDGMARRLLEMSVSGASLPPEGAASGDAPRLSRDSFEEIGRDDAAFRAAEAPDEAIPASPTLAPARPKSMLPPADTNGPASIFPVAGAAPAWMLEAVTQPHAAPSSSAAAPKRPSEVARGALLVFPRDHAVALHSSGLVLVQATRGFLARLESVRSLAYSSGYTTAPVMRRARGRTIDEPLGGALAPIVEIGGTGELVLGPTAGQRLSPLQLDDDPLYVREDLVIGFEPNVTWENGRLPAGEGDAIPMVQLRGAGAVVVQLPEQTSSVEIIEARSTVLRAADVLGWVGRIVPRALAASEAPGSMRGLVACAGQGMVLVHAR